MAGPVAFSNANRLHVTSLYRQALKTSRNWINRYDLYREKCNEIRLMFDANKGVTDPNELNKLLNKTEAMLHRYRHPDPIVAPCRPGGTKYERNRPAVIETPVPGHY